jgi:SOS-response transcriptional repressor LexA
MMPLRATHAYNNALAHLRALGIDADHNGYRKLAQTCNILEGSVDRCIAAIRGEVVSYDQAKVRRASSDVVATDQEPAESSSLISPDELPKLVDLLVVGKIAAGEPISFQDTGGQLLLPENLAEGADFALKVRGHSMIKADIHDGDYVLMRDLDKHPHANLGDLHRAVVAVEIAGLDDEATLKRLVCGENEDHLVLWPENDEEKNVRVIVRRPDRFDAGKLRSQLSSQGFKIEGRRFEYIDQSQINNVRIRAVLMNRFRPKSPDSLKVD